MLLDELRTPSILLWRYEGVHTVCECQLKFCVSRRAEPKPGAKWNGFSISLPCVPPTYLDIVLDRLSTLWFLWYTSPKVRRHTGSELEIHYFTFPPRSTTRRALKQPPSLFVSFRLPETEFDDRRPADMSDWRIPRPLCYQMVVRQAIFVSLPFRSLRLYDIQISLSWKCLVTTFFTSWPKLVVNSVINRVLQYGEGCRAMAHGFGKLNIYPSALCSMFENCSAAMLCGWSERRGYFYPLKISLKAE